MSKISEIRAQSRQRYLSILKSMPEYQSGEEFTMHRLAAAFGMSQSSVGIIVRQFIDERVLTRTRASGHLPYVYRRGPVNRMCHGWGVSNDIPIGRYFGYVPVTLESIVERHAC